MVSYIRIDPLTFYAEEKVTDNVRNEIVNIIQSIIKSINSEECKKNINNCGNFLNKVADGIVDAIYKGWEEYYLNK